MCISVALCLCLCLSLTLLPCSSVASRMNGVPASHVLGKKSCQRWAEMRAREQTRPLVPEHLVDADDKLRICRPHQPGAARGRRHMTVHLLSFPRPQTALVYRVFCLHRGRGGYFIDRGSHARRPVSWLDLDGCLLL